MKKIIIGILFLCVSSISYAFADLGGFVIDGFHVDMDIHTDGSMDVKETIDINFTEQRHGIYREIPIKNTNGDYIHIKNIQVIGDPVAANTITNNLYTLQIGSANSYVYGPKQYVITYTVQNAIKAYASGSNTTSGGWQEFYWNIIGPQWNTTIANSTFTIKLPKENLFSSGNVFLVWGSQGEANKEGAVITQIDNQTIQGGVSAILQPKQGITVGLQFPSDYFIAASNYNELFTEKPSIGFWESLKSGGKAFVDWLLKNIGDGIFWIIFIVFGLLRFKTRGSIKGRTPAWKSTKAITPYYLPPRNIEPSEAFFFWYNAQNPQIFVALLYYWATKGRVHISLTEGKKYIFGMNGEDTYVINELKENPNEATNIDRSLLQKFFGERDNNLDQVPLTQNSYTKMKKVLSELEAYGDKHSIWYEKKGNIFTKKYVLTGEGEKLFEEMRGFKEYLDKVERPVIEKELQNNPDFINMILPRAVLFGVETRLLKLCEDMLKNMEWYDSYNGRALNAATFASMTSNIKSSVIAPSNSGGSSGSGFSGGGGGFSGGGGGGGGGGSR